MPSLTQVVLARRSFNELLGRVVGGILIPQKWQGWGFLLACLDQREMPGSYVGEYMYTRAILMVRSFYMRLPQPFISKDYRVLPARASETFIYLLAFNLNRGRCVKTQNLPSPLALEYASSLISPNLNPTSTFFLTFRFNIHQRPLAHNKRSRLLQTGPIIL
ncbi:hypothetical protein BDM02DRAFT_2747656 [Thelephora ganbajun]|uniref:Uncharacterized protein n=1 Tax=Thelephora ganbajun TaxID=370292 RepID=A0ACB6ZBY8_THEGA|nr:hypothetical protein BDM02DRAFT_2747656 [Thelephora ganbajun]